MHNQEGSSAAIPVTIIWGAASLAAALLIASLAITVSPRHAQATPAYAAETKLPCGKCHVNPAGGGAITAFGKEFAAEGHKWPMPKK